MKYTVKATSLLRRIAYINSIPPDETKNREGCIELELISKEFFSKLKPLKKPTLTKEDKLGLEKFFKSVIVILPEDNYNLVELIANIKENLYKYADISTKKDLKNTYKNLESIELDNYFFFTWFATFIVEILERLELEEKEQKLEKREKALEKKEKALEKKEKKGTYKRSGHLADQMLKYDYPKDKQPDLFSILKEDTIKDIEITGVERSEVVEGIRLTASETKVVDCLCKLLHHRSQTLDKTKEDFYTGNLTPKIVEYSGETAEAPRLAFTVYELAKEYKGGASISGKDVDNLKNTLIGLNDKKFCIRYTEKTTGKGGKWIKREYEKFRPIIDLDLATISYGVEDIELSKRTETIIVLHPIFKRQIDSKFILYPNDINQRIILANGSPKVSEVTYKLRDYLMRELSSKHYSPEIKIDRLYYTVAEKWMKESRKPLVKKYLNKALQVVKDIELLESYEITPSKDTGEPKIVFKLNKKFK